MLMKILDGWFAARDGSIRIEALVGETLKFSEMYGIPIAVTVTTQPAGSNVIITDSSGISNSDALTQAGAYVFTVTSTYNTKTLKVYAFVWPAAVVADGGILSKDQGQQTTPAARRRQVLRAIAGDCVSSAAASLFTSTAFSGALAGGSATQPLTLANYGL